MLDPLPIHFGPPARLARLADDLARAAAPVTLHLHLLDDSRGEHLFDNFDAVASARIARVDVGGGFGACARTFFADDVLFDFDLYGAAGVEVREGEFDDGLHVGPFADALLVEALQKLSKAL